MRPRGAARPRAVARIPRVCAPTRGEDVRAVRCRRGVDHEVALSARGCRQRGELSKVKVTNRLFFFFSPSRSRFQAFPVLSSPRSPPPTFPPRHRQAGQRPPIPEAGCWAPFAGEGCSAALVSSCSSSPWPPARCKNTV